MLSPSDYCLINGVDFDAVPAGLYRARSNAVARAMAGADWLIRDKADGRYIALASRGSLRYLHTLPRAEPLAALWQALQDSVYSRDALPPDRLFSLLDDLGISGEDYARETGLNWMLEPALLSYAGRDRYKRPLWLEAQTAGLWRRMQQAAAKDNAPLQAISGFRSHAYQAGIFARKMARGLDISQILTVNAAPGFSEHHSGRAIDISSPGLPAAEESFEHSVAFDWLSRHAADFGFRLSYPRGNSHGITYEPWHWYWQGCD